ncbi:Gluconolactonase [Fulvivirga imtechensis AK7]|uniref:Gluconolactonase n=1 Tax=Fulvivirga imtechensis AK7 TaxID=1237149 RepID=L8JPT9_9BACT|nr:SMP-30/gluconolactonase/LRE family protein [Fulvivirga imtechensis]ELR69524.1 Gluconolactonase [Fulvivirga imtechensis AK7]
MDAGEEKQVSFVIAPEDLASINAPGEKIVEAEEFEFIINEQGGKCSIRRGAGKLMMRILFTIALLALLCCQTKQKEAMKEREVVQETAFLYIDTIARLGEGAIWNQETREFYWVDIEDGKVFTFNPLLEEMRMIPVGQRVGTVVPSSKEGHVVIALQDGIYSLNLETKEVKLLAAAPYDPSTTRFNDGKCDPAGRLWVGSMALDSKPHKAALYCFRGIQKVTQVLDSISISNGLCWSADRSTMYYVDTPTQTVQAFDYDDASGGISNGRVVVKIKDEGAFPDGMTIDSEGKLWIALWGGSGVVRYDPDTGKLLSRISVPAKNVTSCAFGGVNLDTLFITTASIGMNEEELAKYAMAGAVFAAIPGVRGVKTNFFKE